MQFTESCDKQPQPVALSTTTGTNEVAGCALSRAVIAKKAAIIITIPSAVQSKLLSWLCDAEDIAVVLESICGLVSGTSCTPSEDSVVVSGLSGLFINSHL